MGRGLAEEYKAEVCEYKKHERGSHQVYAAKIVMKAVVYVVMRIHRGDKSNDESQSSSYVAGNFVAEIVAPCTGEKRGDSEKTAHEVVAHGRVVVVADRALEQRMRQRMCGTGQRENDGADREHKRKRDRGDTNGPAHGVVGVDGRVFRHVIQR